MTIEGQGADAPMDGQRQLALIRDWSGDDQNAQWNSIRHRRCHDKKRLHQRVSCERGDGGPGGGGGGLAAQAAIYVQGATLVVEDSTFDKIGPKEGTVISGGAGGGGGGLLGNGGGGNLGGGGGGGARGGGRNEVNRSGDTGGGGGRTVFSGRNSGLRSVAAAQAAIYAVVVAVASITLTLMRRTVPAAVAAALRTSQHGSTCVF